MKNIKVLIITISSLVIICSCRKIDNASLSDYRLIEFKFFNSHRSTDRSEAALVSFMKQKNDRTPFVQKVVSQLGFPIWDKKMSIPHKLINGKNESDSGFITYVPLVRQNETFVNSALVIYVEPGDTTFNYVCDWQYHNLNFSNGTVQENSPEKLALLIMVLNNGVFGDSCYIINDLRLFNFSNNYSDTANMTRTIKISPIPASGKPSLTGKSNLLVEFCYNVTYTTFDVNFHCNHQGSCSSGICDLCPVCITITWSDVNSVVCFSQEVSGTGGGTGATGGSGGSSGGSNNPPECGGIATKSSVQDGCQTGWGTGYNGPPASEPPDSLLNRYSRAIRDYAIQVYDNFSAPNNKEYAFTGVFENDQIVPKELTTNNDSLYVIPKVFIRGIVLFTWHSHVSRSLDPTVRGSFSDADIQMLRSVRCLQQNFVSFADCRNKRYAFVITDVTKAKAFFDSHSDDEISALYTTTGSGNTQDIDERSVKNVIGSFQTNGISFYVSNDAPDFQSWTLLNP